MAIRIHHQPTGFSLGAAYVMGAGRRQERRRKYMLDMWQRDRYLNARFGGMGGRGSRRLADEEPGGRWVDPLDTLAGPATPGQRVTQKAQMRRAARRQRLGLADIDYDQRGVQLETADQPADLRPRWMTAAEVQRQQELEDIAAKRQHDFDLIEARAAAARTDFQKMDPAQQSDAIQGIAGQITAPVAEGGIGYSPQQIAAADKILKSGGLSPQEKYDALKKILVDPQGELKQSLQDQYGANSGLWDFDKGDWADPGAVAGGRIKRVPHDGKGNPDWDQYKKKQEADFNDQNPPHLQAQQKEQEEQTKKNVAEMKKLRTDERTAQNKLNEALAKQSEATLKGEKPTDERKAQLQAAVDSARAELKDVQAEMSELEQKMQTAPEPAAPAAPAAVPSDVQAKWNEFAQADAQRAQEEASLAAQQAEVSAILDRGQQVTQEQVKANPNALPPLGEGPKGMTAEEWLADWNKAPVGAIRTGLDGKLYRKTKK